MRSAVLTVRIVVFSKNPKGLTLMGFSHLDLYSLEWLRQDFSVDARR